MANELKPCPFCGGIEKVKCTLFMSVFQVQCFECKSSAYGSNKKDQAVAAWNTRPAAPVEGLETVRYEIIETLPSGSTRWKCVEHEHHANSVAQMLEHPTVVNALVHRSQSEAIIAAERAEKEELRETLRAVVAARKADNAALTARVKELEGNSGAKSFMDGSYGD